MMERSEIKMIRAGKDDKSILRRIDPDTCRALCDSLEEALDELDRLRAAPPPSPDIAGLVERALSYVNDADQLEHCDPKYLCDDLEEFATALQRVAQERDAARADRDSHQREAIRTMGELAEARARLFPYADDKEISGMSWGGFYLIGNDKSIKELRRIENAAAQIEVYRAAFDERIADAEARIATARDEGMEMAAAACERQSAVFGSTDYATGQPLSSFAERFACERCAEDIRALKGTKP